MSSSVGAVCVGKVEWFDASKGFGFISYPEGDGKDIFVHYSAILASGYKKLEENDEVEFTVSVGARNRLQASQVTVLNRSKGNGSKNDRRSNKDPQR